MRNINFLKNEAKSISTKIALNNSQKLLVGFLALVMVAGMVSPAFAQEIRGDVNAQFHEEFEEDIEGLFDDVCPGNCSNLALQAVLDIDDFCNSSFDSQCEDELVIALASCAENSNEEVCPVGGISAPVSTTTLLVAGAQANMGLWSLALVGAVGAGVAIVYKKKSKKTEQ